MSFFPNPRSFFSQAKKPFFLGGDFGVVVVAAGSATAVVVAGGVSVASSASETAGACTVCSSTAFWLSDATVGSTAKVLKAC